MYDEVALKVQRSIMFHCAVQEYGNCNIDVGAGHSYPLGWNHKVANS